jgi:hypothetical protein
MARVAELHAAGDLESLEDPGKVALHRLRADPEVSGDLVVRAAIDDP